MSNSYLRTDFSRSALGRDQAKGFGAEEAAETAAWATDLTPHGAFDPDFADQDAAVDVDALRRKALRLLARRDHSRAELARKLSDMGGQEGDVAAVLERMEELGFLSDQRFAASFIRAKAPRFGAARLKRDLTSKGVPEDLARDALTALAEQGSELERARQVWQRKFSAAPGDAREFGRQARFLQGRGFSPELIRRLLKEVAPEQG